MLLDGLKNHFARQRDQRMRHDHNASLWSAGPSRTGIARQLTFGGVVAVTAMITTISLMENLAAPPAAAGCLTEARADGCNGAADMAFSGMSPIRTAQEMVAASHAFAVAKPISAAASAAPNAAALPAAFRPMAQPSTPILAASFALITIPRGPMPAAAATDGSGAASADPPGNVAAISDEELTFKSGAALRPGALQALAAAKDARPAPKATRPVRSRRQVAQTYELPDGRQVVVHRNYREPNSFGDGWRLRSADNGARPEPFDFFGGRRASSGFGGLY